MREFGFGYGRRYGYGYGAGVIGLLLVLAGCTDGGPSAPHDRAPSPPPRPSASRSVSAPVPEPASSPIASASPSGSGSASEGRSRAACADTDCEIELGAGDEVRFRAREGVDRFGVTAVDGKGVTWRLPGAQRCGASGPGGIHVVGDDDGCRGTVGAGTTLTAEGVTVTFLDVGEKTVRIRLSPRP
ncbi:hypothetical protein [Streptomyces sp. NPDC051569]|uniref:hypothetical protein n=1 Tax=Streptomyces sp. NPDC051569 TaxID=3365661 RepID=UPI003793C18F